MTSMKVKRLLAILMAIILAFGVFACEDDDDDDDVTKSTSNKVINLSGGNNADGPFAGNGGNLVVMNAGEGGIHLLSKGEADTDFGIPIYTKTVDLGDNGWTVNADTVVPAYAVGDEPADGVYHTHLGDINLYARVGAADVAVTGLRVKKGATLTLELNYDSGDTTCFDQARITLTHDMDIDGVLTVANLTTGGNCDTNPEQRHSADAIDLDSGSLVIDPYRVYIGEKGRIDTRGADAIVADSRGGDGGSVNIYGQYGVLFEGKVLARGGDGLGTGVGGDAGMRASSNQDGIDIFSDGPLANMSKMDCSGGDGLNGGDACGINVTSLSFLFNKGELDTGGGGGDKIDGYGGNADFIDLNSIFASSYNKGALLSNGGVGGLGGGLGSAVYLGSGIWYYGYDFNVYNAGRVDVSGGNALYYGNGGFGGYFRASTYGGNLKTSGKIDCSGGDGAGPYSYGGYGGAFIAEGGYDYNWWNYTFNLPGDIVISNDVVLKGGYGEFWGAPGGYMTVENELPWYALYYYSYPIMDYPGQIKLAGFDKINLNGGKADNGYAGNGGDIGVFSWDIYSGNWYDMYYYGIPIEPLQSAGPIISDVVIEANGGDSDNWYASYGGNATILSYGYFLNDHADVKINKNIGVKGGDGYAWSAPGGVIRIAGGDSVKNSGNLMAAAGDGDYYGSPGGQIYLGSMGNVINNSILSVNGGDGEFGGSSAGMIRTWSGDRIINSGPIRARGGDGYYYGGDGGYTYLWSTVNFTKNKSTISVTGGDPDGDNGIILIDGADATPADGTIGD